MYVIFLTFSANKAQAPDFMAVHNDWLAKGFEDEVFVLSGSLNPGLGGAIIAHNCSMDELNERISDDPFVKENIVVPHIYEISPSKADSSLEFLLSSE